MERKGAHELPVQRLARLYEGAVTELLAALGWRLEDHFRDQLLRSASSVLLNVNEAVSHETPRQKLKYFRIAKASLGESRGGLRSTTIVRAATSTTARSALRLALNHGSQLMGQLTRLTRHFTTIS